MGSPSSTIELHPHDLIGTHLTRKAMPQAFYTYTVLLPSLVEGEGFEPSKAEPSDLQSDPFDRSGTPPNK
ncbi:protein of unknown function [Candidatus Methylocalor cossyra]|uniref:Uncharacterized protein n=1 Tax=Candidatus Methylocalor cossyra TaxID=3108543 RepID=A0ABP1C9S8_9GAMM